MENGDFDELLEQVNKVGNQPIPQPPKSEEVKWTDNDLPTTEAEIVDWPTMLEVKENTLNKKVLLVQPEEQECRGKAASGEHGGVGEANDANQETTTATNKTKGRCEVNPKTAEQHKVNSEEEG